MNKNTNAIAFGLVVATFFAAANANADIRVTCEQRADRSVVSVDAKNLVPGTYKAEIISGNNEAISGDVASIGDEVKVDFSSQRKDQAAGAVAIPAIFIQGGTVTGQVINADNMVVTQAAAKCAVK
ncbi:MAG: hypothetical protein H6R26_1465 [Proteobacteria bacterium]|nr:hypothetical protein [Pseudomonadota bacterium]